MQNKHVQLQTPFLGQKQAEHYEKENEAVGIACAVLSCVMFVGEQSMMSFVFLMFPYVTMWHLIFWRSMVCLLLTLLAMGPRIKRELYDQVTP